MSDIKLETDFGWIAIAALIIMCSGTPDIIDGIIYKLTNVNVWQSELDRQSANKEKSK